MQTIFHDFSEELYSFHRMSDGFDPHYLHFHRYYELSVVTSGDLDIISGGIKLSEKRPVIIFHAPYSFHEIVAKTGTLYDYYVFHFSDKLYETICSVMCSPQPLFSAALTVIPLEDELYAEIKPILAAYHDAPEQAALRKLLLACILEISSRYLDRRIPLPGIGTPEPNPKLKREQDYIREITEYINRYYQDPITAESLAARYYISRPKLDADFKDVMDTTLRQYILDTRIANAVRMLSQGGSIAEVTYDCGFVNESHFIRTFRQRIGITPGQFQKNGGGTKLDDEE